MRKNIAVSNLDCANCASRLERALKRIDGINEVEVSFMAQKIILDYDENKKEKVFKDIVEVCGIILPDVTVRI